MARVQLRNPSEERDYYERKKADGKAPKEAMRCVKRRLSDIVYQQMLNDAITHTVTPSAAPKGPVAPSRARRIMALRTAPRCRPPSPTPSSGLQTNGRTVSQCWVKTPPQ